MRRSNSLLNNLADSANQAPTGLQQPFVPAVDPHSAATPTYEMPGNPGGFGHPAAQYPQAQVPNAFQDQSHQAPPQAYPPAYPQSMPPAAIPAPTMPPAAMPAPHMPPAAMPAPNMPPAAMPAPTMPPVAMTGQTQQLAQPLATPSPDMLHVKATLDGLASRLNSLAEMQTAAMREPVVTDLYAKSETDANIKNLSSAISELQTAISSIQSQPNPTAELADLKAGIEQIREDISTRVVAGLDTRIDPSAYAEAVEKSHTDILSQIREIQKTVEANANSPQFIADTLHARQNDLVSRLDEITAALAKMDRIDDHEEARAMREQLARLDANFSEFSSSLEPVSDISGFGERLDEITRGILALSAPDGSIDNLERIEARMMDLSRDLKEMSEASKDKQSAFDPEILEPYFAQTLSTLKAFEDRLGGIESSRSTAQGFEKLAGDVASLSERVGNLSVVATAAGDSASIATQPALLERLDELVARVECLQSDNKQLEDTTHQFGSLEKRITAVSEQLDAMASKTAGNPVLDERLDALTDRMEQLYSKGASGDASGMLAAVQKQIAAITANLEQKSGNGADFPRLNKRLDGIEKQLGATRDIGIEVAAGAAEEAVRKVISELPTSGSSLDREAVQALLDDIKKLGETGSLAASGQNSEVSTLKSSLENISSRLATIETGLQKIGTKPYSASLEDRANQFQQTVIGGQSAEGAVTGQDKSSAGDVLVSAALAAEQERQRAKQGFEENFAKAYESNSAQELDAELPSEIPAPEALPAPPTLEVSAPQLSTEILPEVSVDETPGLDTDKSGSQDVPIEPGSGGPDLAALVRQANDRRKALSDRGEGSGGTDFLASARRAAQAAALEASEIEKQQEIVSKPKGFLASLPGMFSQNKKAVVIAAAAALLAAVAVPTISKLSSDFQQPELAQSTDSNGSEILKQIAADLSSDSAESQGASTGDNSVVEPVTALPDGSWETAAQDVEAQTESIPASAASQVENAEPPVTPASLDLDLTKADFAPQALQAAVAQNDPFAIFEIARRYTNGIGTEKNLDEAAIWYEQAASLGVVPAQYIIGNFHEKGIGVTMDRTIARAWYEQAARSGHVVSMHNLGVMSASPDPQTGESNFNEAIKWFKKAADYGVRDSQVNLGIFLAKGSGGEVDLVESYKWFSIASRSGDPDATEKRDFVGNALRPDQLEEAKSRAQNWTEQTPNPEVNDVKIPDNWKSNEAVAVLDDRNSIAKAQSLLSKVGFDAGPADGVIGKRTRKAIMDFRTRAGLPINDRIDAELLDALVAIAI